jgi:transposase
VKRDRVRVTNRIKGLLAAQGVRLEVRKDFLEQLDEIRLWDGAALPPGLRARLERAWEQRCWLTERIRGLEAERRALLRTSEAEDVERVRQLLQLDGIGENSAWVFVTEFFGWREFRNRREVGALAGLTPTPFQSGSTAREQGISKAGNRHVRHMAVQVAWAWLRHQPDSGLSRWYNRRFGPGSSRLKKIGIIALARRLLIELWRYLETGTIPEGATLKT